MTLASIVDASIAGLRQALSWPAFGLLGVGVMIGAVVGILPGIGGAATLALLLPFAFGLGPTEAFALLIGVAAVAATTGDLTSILVGIPGEATTAATVVDGHPMARRGEAARAIGASLLSSLAGSLFGAATLALTIPVAALITRSVGSPELFMLALLGISFVAPLSASARVKGLAAGGLGLMLAMVGLDPMNATPRFTFGQLSLWDGIGTIPLALGLFAIPEIVEMSASGALYRQSPAVAASSTAHATSSRIGASCCAARRSAPRSACCRASAPACRNGWHTPMRRDGREAQHPFGRGAVEGVIAPSAANNATLGGALVPTLALGVPGGLSSAMLLSALVMKGLTPGPQLVAPESQGGHLSLVIALVWFMAIANVMAVALSWVATGSLIRITQVRPGRLVPFLLVLTFLGAFAERQSFADLVVTCVMGALGLLLVRYEWPRAPVLMGLVLGPLAENRLFLSMDAYGLAWLARPGVLAITAIWLGTLLVPRRGAWSNPNARAARSVYRDELFFQTFLIVVMAVAFVVAGRFGPRASLAPRLAAAVTVCLLVAALAADRRTRRSMGTAVPAAPPEGIVAFANPAIRWMPVFLASMWGFGFVIGGPLAVLGYLTIVGRERVVRSVMMAGAAYVLLEIVMVRGLDMRFPTGALLAWAGVVSP